MRKARLRPQENEPDLLSPLLPLKIQSEIIVFYTFLLAFLTLYIF